MALPSLTPEQRAEALAFAARARQRRADFKERLKKREIKVSQLLHAAESDAALAKMRVEDMLSSVPRIGPTRAKRLMKELGIAPGRRLRGLGKHQRKGLTDRFG